MAIILQVFGTNTALNVTGLATLADGATAVSDEVDNSVSRNLSEDLEVQLTGTGTATVDIYIMRANDTGIYPSTDIVANMQFIGSVDMNATAPVINTRIEQLPEFYKYVFVNNSGAALTAATVNRQSADLSNA